MSRTDFTLTYDGPALATHEMNVRDLAPAMLAVGELFEALNRLYNGKQADVAVNVTALSPGCFQVGFDIVQTIKDATEFLSGQEVTAALNLKAILGIGAGTGIGLFQLIKRYRGRAPERIEKLTPNTFRLTLEGDSIEIPMELLQAYQELSVRRALEKIVSKPLVREGIEEVRIEDQGVVVERVSKEEAVSFRAPEPSSDVIVEDTRKAAYTIRDLSFDPDGLWKLNDGTNPIKVTIEDQTFLARVESNDIRFAKDDVLLCMVHFVQKRAAKGGVVNEYTVKDVLEHIPAPRQLKFPDPEGGENDNSEGSPRKG
jgi:hypothetical protein